MCFLFKQKPPWEHRLPQVLKINPTAYFTYVEVLVGLIFFLNYFKIFKISLMIV